MKVAVLESNQICLVDKKDPTCNEGEIIVTLKACGICGSDLANINSLSCKPTKKLGHEISGVISKIGNNVNNFQIGDNVLIHHQCCCGKCHFCMHGNETMCPEFISRIEPCGFSEQIIISKWIVDNGGIIKLPPTISFEKGTLIEPLSCCIRAWKKISFMKNDSVAIFGCGPIGVLHGLIARYHEFEVFCIDKTNSRLEFCKTNKIGNPVLLKNGNLEEIHTRIGKNQVDLVVIATSDFSAIFHALRIVRRGGTIMIFGEPKKDCNVSIDMSEFYSKEINMLTSYASTNEDMLDAINMVENNQINLDNLITHNFPLSKIKNAFNFVKNNNRMKVILTQE